MKLLGVALALACCGAGAAKADWEYTKWGMSPEQVLSASNNVARASTDPDDLRPDSDGNISKLIAPYQSGKFSFEAQFGFNPANKLASVTLVLDDPYATVDVVDMAPMMAAGMNMYMGPGVCNDLDVVVNTTYGPPPYHGANDLYAIEKWQDQKSQNNVDYHTLYGVGCYVQYSAIKPAAAN